MRFLVSKQAKIIGGAVFAFVVVVGLAAANGSTLAGLGVADPYVIQLAGAIDD